MQSKKKSSTDGEPTITAVKVTGRLKAHLVYPSGYEIMEEYDSETYDLKMRRFMRPSPFGGTGKWEYEIGEPPKKFDASSELLEASESKNPIFVRTDTKAKFEWRIRNLKWPKEVYLIGIDHAAQQIVVKTTLKKYYKRFGISDLKRLEIPLDETKLAWKYANSTLVIQYDKPEPVIEAETAKIVKLEKIAATQGLGVSAGEATESDEKKCAAQ